MPHFSAGASTEADIVCRRCVVRGRVQGVGFRAYAARLGDRLGLLGFVVNRADGRVEALIQGQRDQVSKFLEFMRSGPPAARVEDWAVTEEALHADLQPFSIGF